MFEKQIELVSTVFSRDMFFRALPLLSIFFGLLLFVISYLAFPATAYPAWHDATKSLGQAILVSGVVSTLLSSLTYIGIFEKAVYNVMYSNEYLLRREDLPSLWTRVTIAICQGKFPVLHDHLSEQILDDYVPTKKDFYYSEYHRQCVVRWADKTKNVAEVEEMIDITLHPVSASDQVNYIFVSRIDSRTPRDIAKLHITHMDIDGTTYTDVLKEEEYDDEFGGKGLRLSYEIPLKGRAEYRIRRSSIRKLALSQDPVLEYVSPQFILESTVQARSESPDLNIVFVGVGLDFEDKKTGPASYWPIDKEQGRLMFPNQGYILFLQNA